MSFNVQLTAPVQREATISAAVAATNERREFYGFRNRRSELPFIQLPIELPVYRMENFRTFTDQRDYITAEGKPVDYFSAGQESESVQQAQHLLLYKLSQKGKSDSVLPVINKIRKEGQREPLLITANGVVVNGNRRLAGFREIFEEDRVEFAHFSHIDFLVLPADATADEIVDIEANLQAMPETKLDYDWIGEAQLIKRLKSLGRTDEQVANQLHRTEKDIKYAMQTLAEADLYLKEARGTSGSYSEIREDAEQLFSDLPKLIEGKSEAMKEASRIIAWTLFQNKDRLGRRLYDFNPAIGKLADDVLERVASELGIETTESNDISDEDDGFAISLDGETDVSGFDAVLTALKGEDNDEAVDSLIDAAQTAIELQKGKVSGGAALKAMTQAHAKIASVDLSKADRPTLPGILNQITAIRTVLAGMEATITKMKQS